MEQAHTSVIGEPDSHGAESSADMPPPTPSGAPLESPGPQERERKAKRGFSHKLFQVASGKLWGRARTMLGALRKVQTLALADKQDFVAENMQALQQAVGGESDVNLEAESFEHLKQINYCQQGDDMWYSPEMIARRHKLRSHPDVMAAIKKWWDWLPRFHGSHEGLPNPSPWTKDWMAKPVYCAMVVVIQMVLLPRYGMKGDLKYDPEEDWLDDNKGQSFMDYPNFFDALFELADMWCDQLDGVRYAQLLEGVLEDAKKSGLLEGFLRKFGWKEPPEAPPPKPKAKPLPKHERPAPFMRPDVQGPRIFYSPEGPKGNGRPTDVSLARVDLGRFFDPEHEALSPTGRLGGSASRLSPRPATSQAPLLPGVGSSADSPIHHYLAQAMQAEVRPGTSPASFGSRPVSRGVPPRAVPRTPLAGLHSAFAPSGSRDGTWAVSTARRFPLSRASAAGELASRSADAPFSKPDSRLGRRRRASATATPTVVSGKPLVYQVTSVSHTGEMAAEALGLSSASIQHPKPLQAPPATRPPMTPEKGLTRFEQAILIKQQQAAASELRHSSVRLAPSPTEGAQQAYYAGPLPLRHSRLDRPHPGHPEGRAFNMEDACRRGRTTADAP